MMTWARRGGKKEARGRHERGKGSWNSDVGDKSARDDPVVIHIQYTYPAQIPQGVLFLLKMTILSPSSYISTH